MQGTFQFFEENEVRNGQDETFTSHYMIKSLEGINNDI